MNLTKDSVDSYYCSAVEFFCKWDLKFSLYDSGFFIFLNGVDTLSVQLLNIDKYLFKFGTLFLAPQRVGTLLSARVIRSKINPRVLLGDIKSNELVWNPHTISIGR